jgi:hypothetical protein
MNVRKAERRAKRMGAARVKAELSIWSEENTGITLALKDSTD